MSDRKIIEVKVPFSEAEYRRLRKEAALMPDGYIYQAVREAMSLQPKPIGMYKDGTRYYTPRAYMGEQKDAG